MPVTLEIAKSIIEDLSQKDKDTLALEMQGVAQYTKELNTLKSQIIALALYEALNMSMTVNECADFLKVNHQTVRSMIDKKEIMVTYCGTKISIPKIQFIDRILDGFLKNKDKMEKQILDQYRFTG